MRNLLPLTLAGALFIIGCDGKSDGEDTATTSEATTVDETNRPDNSIDADDDGYTKDIDCDDANPAINPGAEEVCDDVDNDCDGGIDVDAVDGIDYYADTDGDGYGDAVSSVRSCAPVSGFVDNADDCDDTNAAIAPGLEDACDELDNDCDAAVDEDGDIYYADMDGDGYGDESSAPVYCGAEDGYTTQGGDCDDTSELVYPGAVELCDGAQSDCDGGAWAGDVGIATFIPDADGIPVDLTSQLTGSAGAPVAVSLVEDGVLNLCRGDWYVNLDIEADVAIVGVDGAADTILHGESSGSVVTLQRGGLSASLEGLTLTGGRGGYSAASSGFDSVGGGLICDGDSIMTLTDMVITENEAHYGGGVMTGRSCYLEMTNVEISNNDATESVGGGMYIHETDAAIYDSVITGNTAANNNGGVVVIRGELTIEGSEFSENSTPYRGGGLYLFDGSTAEVTDTIFEGNLAEEGGGAHLSGSDATFTRVSFLDNIATEYGGGIATSSGSTLLLDTCEIDGNTATAEDGGGIHLGGSDTAELVDVTFGTNSPEDLYYEGSYTYGATVSVVCAGDVCL